MSGCKPDLHATFTEHQIDHWRAFECYAEQKTRSSWSAFLFTGQLLHTKLLFANLHIIHIDLYFVIASGPAITVCKLEVNVRNIQTRKHNRSFGMAR